MNIRKAVPADAEMVGSVLMSSYNISDIQEGTRVFYEETEKKINYVVAEEEIIVGIASWIVHGLPKHGLCEMDRLAVLPEYRGKGIAKKLFSFLVEDAKRFYESNNSKLRKLYLLTHTTNGNAQGLYKKFGFSHETTLRSHYYGGLDELVFSMFFDSTKNRDDTLRINYGENPETGDPDFPCAPV